jgi:hypothetical protein
MPTPSPGGYPADDSGLYPDGTPTSFPIENPYP